MAKKVCCLLLSVASLTACVKQASSVNGITYHEDGAAVNAPRSYPVKRAAQILKCDINIQQTLGRINPHVFGTNLEWFNDAGGLASRDMALSKEITELAKQQKTTVMRFPGGTLADFYHWRDGTGPLEKRQKRHHPTDPGTSENYFGSPEYFNFLKTTHSDGLITVNAGTASAQEAADWVAYANQPDHPLRLADGIAKPMNIKLWEIGNELYLPGNPGEQIITVKPEVYAQRYLAFSRAMKKIDSTITTIAIGVAKSHIGPDTQYPEWTKVLLENAADEIDMIAIHNAYFPILLDRRHPDVNDVYPALMASPEAVDRSLTTLEQLIKSHEKSHKIGIAVTEWGALFSFPGYDHYWIDHVKTMGTGIYVARMMQVLMSHPRVQLANYFKLTDRSYMGWINYEGKPKVPFWVFALYANYTGDTRVAANIGSPVYQSPAIGIMMPEKNVAEVTAFASVDQTKGKLYVNLINRSMTTSYPVRFNFNTGKVSSNAKVFKIGAREITAHNGRDLPPELPYQADFEPYSTASPDSIHINQAEFDARQPFEIQPFSVATLVFDLPN